MSAIIKPTPGRVVWYWPSQQEIDAKAIAYFDQTQPLAATVAYAWHDRMVNLSVIDQDGAQFRRTSVTLLQEGGERPHTSEGPFAEWMPYQKGQAAKADATAAPCGGEWGACGATPNAGAVGEFVPVDSYSGKPVADATVGSVTTGAAPLPESSSAEAPAAAPAAKKTTGKGKKAGAA